MTELEKVLDEFKNIASETTGAYFTISYPTDHKMWQVYISRHAMSFRSVSLKDAVESATLYLLEYRTPIGQRYKLPVYVK